MRIIKPVAYSLLVILWMTLIFSTVDAYAVGNQNNTSGSNTAIEGNYSGGATTYESGSTSTTTSTNSSTSNIRSAPPTSSAPGMNTSNNCAMALSGGLQTFSIGVSGGKSYIDQTCELIVLSRTLHSFGMKVSAISLLCTDERVFKAMFLSGTPCPVEGKIGDVAKKLLAEKYNYQIPTYEKFVELEKIKVKKVKIKTYKKSTLIHNDKKD
tara:strand:+ start:167 stop:799 length:633 start_codon:yes stop_codon:yes gene_type:complete